MTPTAVALTLRLQGCTTVPDAIRHAMAAIDAGATAAEAQQAVDAWVALQGQQVQRVFAGRPRRDCCTGIERQHLDVPQTADVTDYLRLKGEIS